MAFPWLFEENFELGTIGAFNSESDTDARLDIAHYAELARIPGLPAPWRGAYCLRVNLAGASNDAYVQEDDGFDGAADASLHTRFMLWVDPRITMANNDEFIIFALQSAGPVNEGVIVINYTTANGLRLGVGETAGAQFLPLTTAGWHTVELNAEIDAGGGNDGSLVLRLDGSPATTVGSLDQGAIIQARLGVMSQDAGTTAGYVLVDAVMCDDARLYPSSIRFPTEIMLTKSGHVFVGQGDIENVSLLSGGATDNVLSVFDTDTGDTNDGNKVAVELKNVTASDLVDPAGMPATVRRGCFIQLSGTNPRALVKLGSNVQGYFSDGRIRQHGLRRLPAPQNA